MPISRLTRRLRPHPQRRLPPNSFMPRRLLPLQSLHARLAAHHHTPFTRIRLGMRNCRLSASRSNASSLPSTTIVRRDIGIVDLVSTELVRRGEGTRPDAEEEAKVLIFKLGLEGADDGARIAEEGGGHGKVWALVAGGGFETPDRGAVGCVASQHRECEA